jgi:hypothetical protein
MDGQGHQLLEKARRCRELADTALTEEARVVLQEVAAGYERDATNAQVPPRRRPLSEAIVA